MANLKYMQDVYEKLHQYPELSLEEYRTAEFIASELKKMGFTVRTNVGGAGVVGLLDFAQPGKTLALRSDMDALPIQEEAGVSYGSENPGVMHACGHDSHMATLLGVCVYAAQNKERLAGKLMAVFQPAEEIVVGAKAMLADGVFAEQKPDRFVGIHNWPNLPSGTLGLQSGPITAYADGFQATFFGEGGHGALPHKTKDPIAMATAALQNAFVLVQRRGNALFPRVLSFGKIYGGTSFNVIPEKVMIEGTVRTIRPEDQGQMIELLHQAFASGVSLHGGRYELEYWKGVPAVVNDPLVTEELAEIFRTKIPEIPVVSQDLASLIGEDVGYFLQEVPGLLLLIGSGQEDAVSELHNPRFLVPNQTLVTGYEALTSIIKGYLGKGE